MKKEEIIKVMETYGYNEAPASTKYHCCWIGGLREHTENVISTSLKINALLPHQQDPEVVETAALLHDIGKLGFPNIPFYLPNPEPYPTYEKAKKWWTPYIVNPEIKCRVRDISLWWCGQFGVNREIFQAVMLHDGLYEEGNKPYRFEDIEDLTMLISIADQFSVKFLEKTKK